MVLEETKSLIVRTLSLRYNTQRCRRKVGLLPNFTEHAYILPEKSNVYNRPFYRLTLYLVKTKEPVVRYLVFKEVSFSTFSIQRGGIGCSSDFIL